MRVWTSRYSNPQLAVDKDITPIGITRYPPRFPLRYELAGNISLLSPTPAMLSITRNDPSQAAREAFTDAYLASLRALGLPRALRMLEGLSHTENVVVLCFEDIRMPGEWCHRQLFAGWLIEETGWAVDELFDPSDPRRRR